MDQSSTDQDKKKLNEDMVVFMKKRSDHDAPRYTARLKTYVDFQRKRQRASTARHNSDYRSARQNDEHRVRDVAVTPSGGRKEKEQKEKSENAGWFGKTNDDEKCGRSKSRSRSDIDPSDACCRRRRRRCGSRRRRRGYRRRSRCRRRRRRCGRRRRRGSRRRRRRCR